MGIFKEVKKPVIRQAKTGGEISALRAKFAPKTPPCSNLCPVGSDIRGWLTLVAEDCEAAWRNITSRNPFPAVCGRRCPHPCEQACHRGGKDGAVSINALERYVGDYGIERGLKFRPLTTERRGEAAVVGSGAAGWSCAYQLALRGYAVKLYQTGEMNSDEIWKAEVQRILDLGVELRQGSPENAVFCEDGETNESIGVLIAKGRLAAEAVGAGITRQDRPPLVDISRIKLGWYKEAARREVPAEGDLTEATAIEEARRCMSCGMCMGCGNCWMYCANGSFEKLPKGNRYRLKVELCNGCGKCSDECPSGYIDMT